MTQELFANTWLVNTLLDEGFIAPKRPAVEPGCNDIYYNLNSFLRISYQGFKPI